VYIYESYILNRK